MCICIHILGCVVFREGRDVYEYGLKLKSVNDTIGLMIQINISGAQLNKFLISKWNYSIADHGESE